MQTLETLVEDTKVGPYAAFIYGLIITFASTVTLLVAANQAIKKHDEITEKVALSYGLSMDSAENVICFQGILHYKNIGLYNGVLAFSPNITCSNNEFNKLKENPAQNIAFTALLFLLIGIFMSWISCSEIKQSNTKNQSHE